jgi:hypothetical protein
MLAITLIKNIIKFSLYIRKFRVEQLQRGKGKGEMKGRRGDEIIFSLNKIPVYGETSRCDGENAE